METTPPPPPEFVNIRNFTVASGLAHDRQMLVESVQELGGLAGESCLMPPDSEQIATQISYLNALRAQAGLLPVVINDEYARLAQAAATLMYANQKLSHEPTSSSHPTCFDEIGERARAGAGSSNLALGYAGVRAIDAYARLENGRGNDGVPHARWVLGPMEATGIGYLDADGDGPNMPASALYAFDHAHSLIKSRDTYISSPACGYVSAEYFEGLEKMFVLSPNKDNFTNATVDFELDGGSIETGVLSADEASQAEGFPSTAIVFSSTLAAGAPLGERDLAPYTITVRGIKDRHTGVAMDYECYGAIYDSEKTSSLLASPDIAPPKIQLHAATATMYFPLMQSNEGDFGGETARAAYALERKPQIPDGLVAPPAVSSADQVALVGVVFATQILKKHKKPHCNL